MHIQTFVLHNSIVDIASIVHLYYGVNIENGILEHIRKIFRNIFLNNLDLCACLYEGTIFPKSTNHIMRNSIPPRS